MCTVSHFLPVFTPRPLELQSVVQIPFPHVSAKTANLHVVAKLTFKRHSFEHRAVHVREIIMPWERH
jgi:hypothetical protein